jgi:hypothetical protein
MQSWVNYGLGTPSRRSEAEAERCNKADESLERSAYCHRFFHFIRNRSLNTRESTAPVSRIRALGFHEADILRKR